MRLRHELTGIHSVHRDPRYFSPNPEEFWPERWLPEEASKIAEARGQEYKLAQGAYMPFHYGKFGPPSLSSYPDACSRSGELRWPVFGSSRGSHCACGSDPPLRLCICTRLRVAGLVGSAQGSVYPGSRQTAGCGHTAQVKGGTTVIHSQVIFIHSTSNTTSVSR